MVSARPYYYWTGIRAQTTSNAQFTVPPPFRVSTQATRLDDDEYVRSVWCAHVSYAADGTGGVPSWYAQAVVRLVVQWDPATPVAVSDINVGAPHTLGFQDLILRSFADPLTGLPVHRWAIDPGPLVLETARVGAGVGVKPSVSAGLFYLDQNGYWSGAAEVANLRRLSVSARVLWRSKSAT